MTVRGVAAVTRVECLKLSVQMRTLLVLVICLFGPFVFAAAISVQNSLPTDTLFGRSVKESGFAVPLVILGFAALWGFPLLTSIVGGDVFSGEDRFGTWKMMLGRSRSRAEIFTGKVFTALAFSTLAITLLACSSIAAGVTIIGTAPVIDLSGTLRPSGEAFQRVALAWASVLPPAFGFTALAVLLSVTSRNSLVGVGLPVVVGLTMQLLAFIDSPEVIRRLMITSAFGAWHGLFTEPSFYRPLVHGTLVSGFYFAVCLVIAYNRLRRRDIAG